MTNLEAIKASIGGNYPVDDASFIMALEGVGIDPYGTYLAGKAYDMALIALIDSLIAGASRISEGGYTVEINTDGLLRLRSLLLGKWGLVDYSRPVLRDQTNLW